MENKRINNQISINKIINKPINQEIDILICCNCGKESLPSKEKKNYLCPYCGDSFKWDKKYSTWKEK